MAIVTKNNVKEGMTVFSACDERPFYGCSYEKGVVTAVFDDHYLYDLESGICNMWGDYEEVLDSTIAVFTTEEAAKKWLNR